MKCPRCDNNVKNRIVSPYHDKLIAFYTCICGMIWSFEIRKDEYYKNEN